jgi:hypothetical protein
VQAERARQLERRRRAERVAVRHQHQRQVRRRRLGEVEQPPGLGVTLDVVPAVGHVVAGQEQLDVVAAVRPPVPDHPHLGGVVRVGPPPVAEADVVDRLDGHVGVGIRGEQQQLGPRGVGPRLGEQLDPGHLGHPLVGGDHRHRVVAQGEPGQHHQRLGPRGGLHHPVLGPVLPGQVAPDRGDDLGVVIDREDGWLAHGYTLVY